MKPLHLDERVGLLLCFILGLWVGFQFFFPVSHWLDVRKLEISDSTKWENVKVDLDRTIVRDFRGEWFGTVRRMGPTGWLNYANTTVTRLPYKSDNKLPDPLPLSWLMKGSPDAYELPCGHYEVTITWITNPQSFIFKREVIRVAEFRIWGNGKCIK